VTARDAARRRLRLAYVGQFQILYRAALATFCEDCRRHVAGRETSCLVEDLDAADREVLLGMTASPLGELKERLGCIAHPANSLPRRLREAHERGLQKGTRGCLGGTLGTILSSPVIAQVFKWAVAAELADSNFEG